MSEAVDMGYITKFEEKLINRAVDVLREKIKGLYHSDFLKEMTEKDTELVSDIVEALFNKSVYVSVLRGAGIEIQPYQLNCAEGENGIEVTDIVFRVFLTVRRTKKDMIDITDMIEGTKGINHFILNPSLQQAISFRVPSITLR